MIIHCSTIEGKPGWRKLDSDFHIFGHIIPKGFEWNGASSPATPLIRALVPKFYRTLRATALHDYLCGFALNKDMRKVADDLFYKALIEIEGMAKWRAWIAYRGVRIGAMFAKYGR